MTAKEKRQIFSHKNLPLKGLVFAHGSENFIHVRELSEGTGSACLYVHKPALYTARIFVMPVDLEPLSRSALERRFHSALAAVLGSLRLALGNSDDNSRRLFNDI